jgi:pyruvate dehydrogenase E1 component beta subunit
MAQTNRLVVVDEDYERFGLSGELSAIVVEAGLWCRFARVCAQQTNPYAESIEDQVLPNVDRIRTAALFLCKQRGRGL